MGKLLATSLETPVAAVQNAMTSFLNDLVTLNLPELKANYNDETIAENMGSVATVDKMLEIVAKEVRKLTGMQRARANS
jgi:hypothetical protein